MMLDIQSSSLDLLVLSSFRGIPVTKLVIYHLALSNRLSLIPKSITSHVWVVRAATSHMPD